MPTTVTEEQSIQTLEIRKEEMIDAPIETVFQAMLDELGPESRMPGGQPLPMKLEAWPGGRWYRDLGNNAGHLWGHVQVIKPPVLLELSGPMFMSYPALNHVELRLDQIAGGTKVTLRHRAIGLLDAAHREGVHKGWRHYLDSIGKDFADGAAAHRA